MLTWTLWEPSPDLINLESTLKSNPRKQILVDNIDSISTRYLAEQLKPGTLHVYPYKRGRQFTTQELMSNDGAEAKVLVYWPGTYDDEY